MSIQILADMFWTKFSEEHLPTPKKAERKNGTKFRESSLVMISYQLRTEAYQMLFLLLARIMDVHEGSDRIVRWCKIKIGNKTLVWSCNRLCLLEQAD